MNRRRSTPSRLQPYVTRAFHGDATPHRPSVRVRIVRRTASALAAVAIVASLIPAFAGIPIASLTVSCDPTRVGVATTCRATITETVSTTDNEQGMTKPITRGVFTRDSMPSAGTPVHAATDKIYWNQLEATRDVITLGPIENALDTAESRGLTGVRLRIMPGAFAPDWAKALGTGPIPYVEPQSDIPATVPCVWCAEYRAEVQELFNAIAARYDSDARVLAVFATGGATYYGEPFIRGFSEPANRQAFLAAGYTQALDKAVQKWQLDIMQVFQQTPVGLAYNPWQFIRDDGGFGSSVPYAAEVMDHHLALFGERTILQNNSIRSSYISDPPALYDEFLARLSAPGTTQYQAAGASHIGDADLTMNWAIDYLKASGVELVNGYTDFHTEAELTDYDTALKVNDSSGQTAPHAVTWVTSADGAFGAGSCAADAAGGTTCEVRYVPRLGSVGSHTITATYAGSSTATVSASTQLRVSPRLSATTLTCATPVPAGAKSSCTASVSDGSGGEVSAPTGTVRIAVDGAVLASCGLIATSGSASGCAVDVVAASGTHQVTARYGGDTDHEASASGTVSLTVEAPLEEPPSEEPPPEEPPEPPADTTAPTVTILSPVDGEAIPRGKVTITVETSDDVGVTKVEFLVNGLVKCADSSPASWTCAWTLSNKPVESYTLSAIAYDAAGNRAEHSITVTPLR
jgi:hypothetical protein